MMGRSRGAWTNLWEEAPSSKPHLFLAMAPRSWRRESDDLSTWSTSLAVLKCFENCWYAPTIVLGQRARRLALPLWTRLSSSARSTQSGESSSRASFCTFERRARHPAVVLGFSHGYRGLIPISETLLTERRRERNHLPLLLKGKARHIHLEFPEFLGMISHFSVGQARRTEPATILLIRFSDKRSGEIQRLVFSNI